MPIKNCGKCGKTVYPTEELKCLDKVWHKMCFKCEVCNMTLNMKNYKGYDKRPYCNTHYPSTKFTAVADTPENRRIQKNTQFQSNVKYHEDFEKQKGSKISVADDPETHRVKKLSQNISNVAYHGELERKAEMEQRRPDQEYDFGSAPPPGHPPPQNMQAIPPANQPYRRQPGSLADYDPMMREESRPSPYSAKVQSTQVFNSGRAVDSQQSERRRVGSIADYDPVNENYGSLGGAAPAPGQGYHQPPPPQQQPQQQQQPNRNSGGYMQQQEPGYGNTYYSWNPVAFNPRAPPVSTQYYASQEPELPPSSGYGYQRSPQQVAPPPSQGVQVRAMYDYSAADNDEVSFMEGDLIVNCESIDEGWMTGTVKRTGEHGMLPANYVESV